MIKRVDISPVADSARSLSRPKAQGPGEDFASVLGKALEPAPTSPTSSTPATVPAAQGVATQGVQAVEELLNALEAYAQGLASSATLKELEGLLNQLDSTAAQLRKVLGAGLDQQLEKTARHALALAEAEVLKFNRGDYLPPEE